MDTGGGRDEEDEEEGDDEKDAREGLSGSGLPRTRAWRLRGEGAAWLPWLPTDEDEEAAATTTGTTAA